MHTQKIVPWIALASLTLAAVLLPRAYAGEEPLARLEVPDSPEAFASTEFGVCDGEGDAAAPPSTRRVDAAELDSLLQGVWVGDRVARDGQSLMPELVQGREPPGHYVMIIDMHAGRGIAYEERGPDVRENAFQTLLPTAEPRAPRIVQLYCGGNRFHAFRDEFTRVSTDPRDGLRVLGRVTGIRPGGESVADSWAALTRADFFVRPRGQSVITGAFYAITTAPVREMGSGAVAVRWRMVGEYRGTPAKFTRGQPVSGVESGVFTGVATQAGTYWVAGAAVNTALAVTSPGTVDVGHAEASAPADETYTRMVIGPAP
jgi:hypothetical protein